MKVTRRRVLLAVLALFLFGVGSAAWTLAGLPPVKYYLRYGLDPYCEPTGAKEACEGVEFIEIGPGIFRMGSTYLAEGGDWLGKICAPLGLPWGKHPEPSEEMPVHWVEFRRGYWIATTEVTNAQYERFRADHEPSPVSNGSNRPVVGVSWDDAKEYCRWLAKKSGRPTRLPSEAEWECACRAGRIAEFTFGDDEAGLSEYAWFEENMLEPGAHAVGVKRPNRWGLHDLHGNVWEWCEDTLHVSYEQAPADGSAWTDGGVYWRPNTPFRVIRGGGWGYPAEACRSASRGEGRPTSRIEHYLGFRPAFSSTD